MMINKSGPRRVLTIDDEKAIRISFRNYLEDYDYLVEEAENGREGLEKISSFKPDVVMVDLRMPEVDGLGVLDAVKQLDENLPVIVISGTGEIADVVAALRKGAWDYILKPVQDMSIVIHAIEKVWERAELIRKNHEYQNELEKRVEERTAMLHLANEDLKAFDYSVSNALQAPLRIVAGFCQILLEDHLGQLDDDGQRYFSRIVDSVEECRDLIRELLKMSRVTQKELEKEEICLNDYLRVEFLKTVKKYEADNSILELPEPLNVAADPFLISFALNAIVDNAIKNSIHLGKPVITLSSRKHEGSIIYSITDNGDGISQERVEKIFEPFHSFHTDVDFSGTGLGLATAKRIFTRHGGKLWAECNEEPGMTISFTLPAE